MDYAKVSASSTYDFPHYFAFTAFFEAVLAGFSVDLMMFLEASFFTFNVSVIRHGVTPEGDSFF